MWSALLAHVGDWIVRVAGAAGVLIISPLP